ncbi:MAG: choice-of-anchor Q domain-containing protein, partial [Chloroflexota bacterium]
FDFAFPRGVVNATNIVTVENLTIVTGAGISNGGTLTLRNITVRNADAGTNLGGGVYNSSGDLWIENSHFEHNRANLGSGLYHTGGTMFVINSTINGNQGGNGAGILTAGNFTSATIINSTIVDNISNSTAGGGIYNTATLTLIGNTIYGNSAATNGASNVFIGNTSHSNAILANNLLGGALGGGADCFANPTQITFVAPNLIEDGSCGAAANGQLTGDPLVDPNGLRFNGGILPTLALTENSPALNAGDNTYTTELVAAVDFNNDGDFGDQLDFDQRQAPYARILENTVDLGAYEGTVPVGSISGRVLAPLLVLIKHSNLQWYKFKG